MNLQSLADSFIRSGGAPFISQSGSSYPGMINKEGTEVKFQSSVYPAPGDILTLLNHEYYMVVDVFPKLQAETVASVCRLRFTADFSRYPETTKDSFGRDTATPVRYLEDHYIYVESFSGKTAKIAVPRWYRSQLLDIVSIEGTDYIIQGVTKSGGVCLLQLHEAS